MLRLFRIDNGLIREIPAEGEALARQLDSADWIDAHEPSEEERARLQALLHAEPPDIDDVEEIEATARCFVDQAGIHVHALFLPQAEGPPRTESVAFILQEGRLITIRDVDSTCLRLDQSLRNTLRLLD